MNAERWVNKVIETGESKKRKRQATKNTDRKNVGN